MTTLREAAQQAIEALELIAVEGVPFPAGRQAIAALQAALAEPIYPLPDDLYPGSKDWAHGSYAERVEWLHMMYESAKDIHLEGRTGPVPLYTAPQPTTNHTKES